MVERANDVALKVKLVNERPKGLNDVNRTSPRVPGAVEGHPPRRGRGVGVDNRLEVRRDFSPGGIALPVQLLDLSGDDVRDEEGVVDRVEGDSGGVGVGAEGGIEAVTRDLLPQAGGVVVDLVVE